MTDFACNVGDTLKIRLQVYTGDDRKHVQDLSDCDVTFHAADRPTSPRVVLDKNSGDGVEITPGPDGGAVVTLSPEDTSAFGSRGGTLVYYVRLVEGEDVYTIHSGRIVVKKLPI